MLLPCKQGKRAFMPPFYHHGIRHGRNLVTRPIPAFYHGRKFPASSGAIKTDPIARLFSANSSKYPRMRADQWLFIAICTGSVTPCFSIGNTVSYQSSLICGNLRLFAFVSFALTDATGAVLFRTGPTRPCSRQIRSVPDSVPARFVISPIALSLSATRLALPPTL